MMNEPDDLERGDSAPPAPDAAPVAARDSATNKPPSLATVPTIYPPSPPLEDALHDFWGSRTAAQESAFDDAAAPADRRSIIEKLGPSPFERGGFPIVGFLATVYERVGQFARDRLKEREKG